MAVLLGLECESGAVLVNLSDVLNEVDGLP
jgi:hypothetical protein